MTDAQRLYAAGRGACGSCIWRGEDLVGLCRYHREILTEAQAEHVEKLTRLQRWRQRMAATQRAAAVVAAGLEAGRVA